MTTTTAIGYRETQQFVRPPRSAARIRTPPLQSPSSSSSSSSFMSTTMQNSVQRAYQQAPDLGVTKAVQDAYNRAPDLGVQSTVERWRSGGDGESNDVSSQQQNNNNGRSSNGDAAPSTTRKTQRERLRELTKERGPSSKERLDKPQKDVGTEYGIPTRAGAASTVSPDATNQSAIDRSKKQRETKPQQAHVPEDYLAEACPDKNAGTGKVDDVQREQAQWAAGSHDHSSSSQQQHSPKQYHQTAYDRNSMGNASPSYSPSSTTSEKRRSFGIKMRDQIRGEMKIWKGTIKNSTDTINEGISIKKGEDFIR